MENSFNMVNTIFAEKVIFFLKEKLPEYSSLCEKNAELVEKLKKTLGNAEIFDDMCHAREELNMIEILYAGNLGFQANLACFKNPMASTFLDVSWERFLKEKTMRQLLPYVRAYERIQKAIQMIPEDMDVEMQLLFDYFAFLDSSLPKLAHYKGFAAANELLPYMEPGYVPDMALTHAYQRMMNNWFEIDFE